MKTYLHKYIKTRYRKKEKNRKDKKKKQLKLNRNKMIFEAFPTLSHFNFRFINIE